MIRKKKDNKALKTTIWFILILLWTAISIISSQVVVGYLMIMILGKETFAEPMPTAIFSALSYVLAMGLILFVPPMLKKCWSKDSGKSTKNLGDSSLRAELGLRGLPTWTDIGLAPVGYLVFLVLGVIMSSIFSIFPWFDANQVQDVGFNTYMAGGDRVIAFITLVVVAPIAEEIIFRGWLYGKLRNKFSSFTTNMASIVFSALLVSILFGAIHMQWNVGVNVFALSLVLCTLREITGTIYSGILLHMLKNGLAFYLLYVLGIS